MALARHSSDNLQVDARVYHNHVVFYVQYPLPGHYLSKERVVEIMRRPCADCRPFDDGGQQLCSVCQHWRFWHLFNCVLKSDTHQDRQGRHCAIRIHPRGTCKLSKGCAFCNMIRRSLKIDPERPRRTDPKMVTDEYPSLQIFLDKMSGIIQYLNGPFHFDRIHVYPPADVPDCVQLQIQWSLIKSWLMECTQKHDMCHSQYFGWPKQIRFIDVQRRKLVKKNESCNFVALSYVWGTNPNPERLICLKSNVEELEQDNALKAAKLPQTIEDALQVCKHLGENYLWVDRLCIVQDDASQKHEQIEAMANIYSSASLVLVALDGDMETGLPGIQPRPPGTQRHVEIAGLVYVNELPHYQSLIDASDWATRGWTYQEAALAKRKLYFSWAQVFLQCNTEVTDEDGTTMKQKHESKWSFLAENGWSYDKWEDHLEKYTARSLSYQSDIYNAITGVANAFLPEPASWLYGLPRRDFEKALLWFTDLEQGYRISNGVLLPRWSWSSVKGRINCYVQDCKIVYAGTAVSWNYQEDDGASVRWVPVRDSGSVAYVRPKDDGSRLIYSDYIENGSADRDAFMIFAEKDDSNCQKLYTGGASESSPKLLCYAIAWSQGCIDAGWPYPALSERTFLELGVDLEKRWQEVDYLERDIIFCAPQQQHFGIPDIEMGLDRSILMGRAQTSFFSLEEIEAAPHPEHYLTIVNNEGRPAGQLDKVELEKTKISLQCSITCMYELVALSIGFFVGPGNIKDYYGDFITDDPVAGDKWFDVLNYELPKANGLTPEEIRRFCEAVGAIGLDISYIDSEGSALSFIPIVHVMLAEWDGPVARRISLGWVFLTRWVKSNPQFKTVYLA